MPAAERRPVWRTADLPGGGGVFKASPEDFVVDEIPLQEPEGQGDHLYVFVEKRDLATADLVRRASEVLGVASADIGTAGLKDRRALTRQWLSLPRRCEADLARLEGEGVRVLRTSRHPQKLRTGQLWGNRFDVCLRDVDPGAEARARAIIERLHRDGLPNFYGAQRFGRDGSTASTGFALLRGGDPGGLRNRAGRFKRLALSAAQSALFNAYLRRRMLDGLLESAIEGEVLLDRKLGGLSLVIDRDDAQAMIQRGRAVPAGPMFGPKMRRARAQAAAREAAVLFAAGLEESAFERFEKLTQGTRRAVLVWPQDVAVSGEAQSLRVAFALPAGSYATVLLDEIVKDEKASEGAGFEEGENL